MHMIPLTNADIEEIVTKFHLNKQCDYAISRANHSEEKSNKCNQCDNAPSRTGDLRKHLKMHSGVKSNKCNQCDFASSQLRLVYLDIMQYF